jgi:hypothetical protein
VTEQAAVKVVGMAEQTAVEIVGVAERAAVDEHRAIVRPCSGQQPMNPIRAVQVHSLST